MELGRNKLKLCHSVPIVPPEFSAKNVPCHQNIVMNDLLAGNFAIIFQFCLSRRIGKLLT